MTSFIDKIESFLFDLLGLALPGLVFIILLWFPVSLISMSSLTQKELSDSYILSFLHFISRYSNNIIKEHDKLFILVFVLIAYLIGHVVKVFSIIFYETLWTVFDDLIKVPFDRLYIWIFKNNRFSFAKKMFEPLRKIIVKIFSFRSREYFEDTQLIVDDCARLINSKVPNTFQNKWNYTMYKLGIVIIQQENLKSNAYHFLAKYNLYRSLSFIFAFIMIYYLMIFKIDPIILDHNFLNIQIFVLVSIFVMWFTFHVKYKRYWTLCGNETLMTLFYFLNKAALP